MKRKKVIIIGAGAAGLMAACAAADAGADVTVLEHNEKAGKKLYITGKGRCNYSNACEDEDFFGNVLRNPKFLYSALYGFDQRAMTEFLNQNGCATKVERGNRCFPASDHAYDVTDALVRHLRAKGGKIRFRTEVRKLLTEMDSSVGDLKKPDWAGTKGTETSEGKEGTVSDTSDKGREKASSAGRIAGVCLANGKSIPADVVIVATGGLSYPSTGSTGAGYRFAEDLGIEVNPQSPSLVPFTVSEEWVPELQGLSLKNIAVKMEEIPQADMQKDPPANTRADNQENAQVNVPVKTQEKVPVIAPVKTQENVKIKLEEKSDLVILNGKYTGKRKKKKTKPVYEGFGEMLFTHFGVSGPLILSASCHTDFREHPEGYLLHLDLKPALSQEELETRLHREFENAPRKELRHILRNLLPERLAETAAFLFGEREKNFYVFDKGNTSGFEGGKRQPEADMERRAVCTLNEREVRELAAFLKDFRLHVTGTRGFPEAVITRGGVSVKEINPSTMESRKIKGLYFAGEVLDVDAYTGGFNLQIAWSTGHLAGENAAKPYGNERI